MEGYGRWVFLAIFSAMILMSMYEKFRRDREDFWMHIFLLVVVPIGAAMIFGLAYFIYNYW